MLLNQLRDPKFPLHVMVANIQMLSIHTISKFNYLCQHDKVVNRLELYIQENTMHLLNLHGQVQLNLPFFLLLPCQSSY